MKDAQRLSQSDLRKRNELLAEFLYYLFDSLLIPLIRSHFYVTESSMHRNHLLYFRHDIWQKLSEPSLRVIKTCNMKELAPQAARSILSSRTLSFSQLRLLPKRSGMRQITNLRRRLMMNRNGKMVLGTSINASLGPVFSMLNYEKTVQQERLGSSLFSVGEIHGKLRDYKQRAFAQPGQHLYFVKLDVQSCFDSIPQEKLVSYIKTLVSAHQYSIKKHAEIRAADPRWSTSGSVPFRKFVATASPATNQDRAESLTSHALLGDRRTVIVDTGYRALYDTRKLTKLLDEHVCANLVKIEKKYYKQRVGIPQGSILSSLLCNLFYGFFERSELGFLGQESLLLRLIDDFLLITTNQSHARRLLQIMIDGNDQFGITANQKKSLVNFNVSINGALVPQLHRSDLFPYCGMFINTRTLEVSKDKQREDPFIGHSLSVELNRSPGQTFKRRLLGSFKIQMHAMVLDTNLNSLPLVMESLYLVFLETAMKMHAYLDHLFRREGPNPKLLIRASLELLELAVNLTRGDRSSKAIDSYQCEITRKQLSWLLARGFEEVFRTKQTRYRVLLAWLSCLERDSRPSLRDHSESIARILSNGSRLMTGYRY